MEIKIYRVFEFYTHVVWSMTLTEEWAYRLDNRCFMCLDVAQGTNIPYVYTKKAAPDVARDLASIGYEDMAKIVEAYPASYNHAPNQEIGIGLGIDHNSFELWPCWKYNKVSGPDCVIRRKEMTDEVIAQRRWNKKRRPLGFPEEIWTQLPVSGRKIKH